MFTPDFGKYLNTTAVTTILQCRQLRVFNVSAILIHDILQTTFLLSNEASWQCAPVQHDRLLQLTNGIKLPAVVDSLLHGPKWRNKIVASLLPVCCWIQRDTSRPWHKWIVIMLPRYSQHVFRTRNLLPGNMLPRCKRGYTRFKSGLWLLGHMSGSMQATFSRRMYAV